MWPFKPQDQRPVWVIDHEKTGANYVRINFGGGDIIRKILVTPTGREYVNYYNNMAFLHPGESNNTDRGHRFTRIT